MLLEPGGGTVHRGDESLLESWTPAGDSFVWVDFDREDPGRERRFLERRFELATLAVDDALRDRHPPKLEWFDDYYFLLLKGFTAETSSIDYSIVHISLFVGRNFLVTRHADRSPSADRVWEMASRGEVDLARGPGHVCYRIVRTVIDRYTPIILGLEQRLAELEELMLANANDDLLAELVTYNSRLKKLRRIFSYQQVILNELARSRSPLIHAGGTHELQDAYEQMERLASLSGILQELARDLMDGYLSVSAHRLNNIMKVLTIASVIFLPLTFVAGIYGMNFEHMPELHSASGYFIVLAVMVLIAAGLLVLFRRMRWI